MTDARRPSQDGSPGASFDSGSWRKSNSQRELGDTVDNYQIGQIIGRGGFAVVHKAIHLLTAEVVAAKKFEAFKIAKETIAKIMAEATLLKSLQHPNIVRFIEVTKKKESLYLFTEFVEGGSIASLIEEFGCLPESVCAVYVPQILSGLAYLHGKGIIHRDIKGSNILLTKGGQIKLSDFGVSAILNDVEKRFSVVGTPYWIAPEVIKLEGWTDVSDIWSLGCTIVEILLGAPPYFDLYPMAAMYKIVEEPMPIPEDGISPPITDFLRACFTRPASARPGAAKLLAHSWIAKESAAKQASDLTSLRTQLREMTTVIEEAEASRLREKLDAATVAYAKQRQTAKGTVRKNQRVTPGLPDPAWVARPDAKPRPASVVERKSSKTPPDPTQPGRASPSPVPPARPPQPPSKSPSTDRLASPSPARDSRTTSSTQERKEREQEDEKKSREKADREREKEKKEREADKERESRKDKETAVERLAREKEKRERASKEAEEPTKAKSTRNLNEKLEHRRSLSRPLEPSAAASGGPLKESVSASSLSSLAAGSPTPPPRPARSSTSGDSLRSSATKVGSSSAEKALERPPSPTRRASRRDSTPVSPTTERDKDIDKYRLRAEEARAETSRVRHRLEELEKEMKALKELYQTAIAQLEAENARLAKRVQELEAASPTRHRDLPPTPGAAESSREERPPPSRSDTWANTKELNESLAELHKRLRENEEKAAKLADAQKAIAEKKKLATS